MQSLSVEWNVTSVQNDGCNCSAKARDLLCVQYCTSVGPKSDLLVLAECKTPMPRGYMGSVMSKSYCTQLMPVMYWQDTANLYVIAAVF